MKHLVVFVLNIAPVLAGFLSASAQNNVPTPARLNPKDAIFESQKPSTIKKAEIGQDWWEPDTVFVIYNGPSGAVKRHIFEYYSLSQGLLATDTIQWWSNNSSANFQLYTYTYDSNNNLLTKLQQDWQNNSWVNALLYTYTYDFNNNMLTELWQNWQNNSWVSFVSYSYSYTYDSINNILTEIQQSEDNNSWVNVYSHTYTYDSINNKLTKLYQNWQNNSWVNSYLCTYTYDSDNNTQIELWQNWENNSWINSFSNTYTYDSDYNVLTELLQNWENNSWVNTTQYRRIYDEIGNGISVERLIWINENWQLSSVGGQAMISLWLYYNNMRSVFEEWGCDKITASYKKISDLTSISPPATLESNAISIYPNPTKGELRIETGGLKIENVELFDIHGRKILDPPLSILNSQFSTFNSFDISHLPAGMYFVKIATVKGIVTKKIVKR